MDQRGQGRFVNFGAAPELEAANRPGFYRFTRWTLRGCFRALYGFEVAGLEHLPPHQACIVVCNHTSNLDPPVLGTSIPDRQLFFMAKKELFAHRLLGPVISALGSFPVDRSGPDRRSFRYAMHLLETGRSVGIFPEGTRSLSGEMQPWHVGMALLASKAQVPLVPAAIQNTRPILEEGGWSGVFRKDHPIRVRFGVPIRAHMEGKGLKLQALTDIAYAAVANLLSAGN